MGFLFFDFFVNYGYMYNATSATTSVLKFQVQTTL